MRQLKVFVSPEIFQTELFCLKTCHTFLKKEFQTLDEVYPQAELKKKSKDFSADDCLWFWTKDWRRTINEISNFSLKQKCLISVLSTTEQKSSVWGVLFETLKVTIPSNVMLVAHSPLSYRFLVEIVGLAEAQVVQLPLPLPSTSIRETNEVFSLGCLCPLVEENNLHFILTVAHSLKKKKEDFNLWFLETGHLRSHLEKLALDLDLKDQVNFLPFGQKENLDVLLYFPERNDHFIPVLLAASKGAVPVTKSLPGIGQFIADTQSGFVFEEETTGAIADSLFALSKKPELCCRMGAQFQQKMVEQLDPDRLVQKYVKVLQGL